jgi:hypothetical protein
MMMMMNMMGDLSTICNQKTVFYDHDLFLHGRFVNLCCEASFCSRIVVIPYCMYALLNVRGYIHEAILARVIDHIIQSIISIIISINHINHHINQSYQSSSPKIKTTLSQEHDFVVSSSVHNQYDPPIPIPSSPPGPLLPFPFLVVCSFSSRSQPFIESPTPCLAIAEYPWFALFSSVPLSFIIHV